MKSKYQIEIDAFRNAFSQHKNKKIAIYGIGRRTATLLPGISDFQVVGLLDRDSANQGMMISGIPVISLDAAEEMADMLVINSDPTNFLTIYRRIVHTSLPVYYANGEKAELPREDFKKNSYWQHNQQEAEAAIKAHDVISFDFFDTLAMRKILTPTDLFFLLNQRAKKQFGISFDLGKARHKAAAQSNGLHDLSLSDIYRRLAIQEHLDKHLTNELMHLEMELELEVCVPRKTVVELLQWAQLMKKDVYIISDTYFSMEQMLLLLKKCEIDHIKADHIFLSSSLDRYKQDGSMWDYFTGKNQNKTILHFGDHIKADVELPKDYGIDTFYLMSGQCMLENSSLATLLPKAVSFSHSVHLGLLITKLLNNPFALSVSQGKVNFYDAESFGYITFGGVMTRFLMWLYNQAIACKYDRLLFFARDGYFLQRDFQVLQDQFSRQIETMYVPISRRLIYLATMETEEDFQRVMTFPYIGTFAGYLASRFNIQWCDTGDGNPHDGINAASDGDKLSVLLQPYKDKIWQEARTERDHYLRYLQQRDIVARDSKDAIVDFSYYGTNQYYFQRLLKKTFDGYYFSACYADDNAYRKTCVLRSCFNGVDDPEAKESFVKKKSAFLESFLTAPYGMIRYINESGKFICEPDKKNQKNFSVKEQVNAGILNYMEDYLALYGLSEDSGVDDTLEAFTYYTILNQTDFVTDEIRNGFYFDNDMIGSKEMPLEL